MTTYTEQLYQEVILDHNKNPRNYGELVSANAYAHGHNPLCGDDYQLYLDIDDKNIIRDVRFTGSGCAISKSSASLMTHAMKNKSVDEARNLVASFLELVTRDDVSEEARSHLGGLKIFEGVKKFPARVKCAMLIWRTLEDAVNHRGKQVEIVTTTE